MKFSVSTDCQYPTWPYVFVRSPCLTFSAHERKEICMKCTTTFTIDHENNICSAVNNSRTVIRVKWRTEVFDFLLLNNGIFKRKYIIYSTFWVTKCSFLLKSCGKYRRYRHDLLRLLLQSCERYTSLHILPQTWRIAMPRYRAGNYFVTTSGHVWVTLQIRGQTGSMEQGLSWTASQYVSYHGTRMFITVVTKSTTGPYSKLNEPFYIFRIHFSYDPL